MQNIVEPVIFNYNFNDTNVGLDMVSEVIGYTKAAEIPQPLTVSVDEIIEKASSLINIRGAYMLSDDFHIDLENRQIFSNNILFETKQIVTHQLRRSEKAVWFLCTAGEEISEYSRFLMQHEDMIAGYVVDVLSNIVVDRAMDKIQNSLKYEMEAMGLKITNRYSPGYCDWDISEQKKLFQIFPENFLNISLTESCLMIPTKSVSGIIGIGKEVKFNEYTCNLCNDVRCSYRNK